MSVDHDLLADYVGGALEGTPEQGRVADLIAASPEWCRAADELAAALHGVQHDLDVLRETAEPMPADVAARFEGLFDGPRRDPLESRVVTQRSKQSKRSKRSGQASTVWKRWAAPVAIAAAALGLYAIVQVPSIVAPTTMQDSAGSRGNAEMPEQAAAAPQVPVPTAVTWRSYDRGNLQSSLSMRSGYGTDAQLPPAASAATTKTDSAPMPLQRLTDPVALQRCLNAVTAVLPGRVEFVEYAYFEGSPALVITITSAVGQSRFVAGGNCGLLGPDEKFQAPPK
jgi:hypothetical protein